MTEQDRALEAAKARLAEQAKLPPGERFDQLVHAGIITRDGKLNNPCEHPDRGYGTCSGCERPGQCETCGKCPTCGGFAMEITDGAARQDDVHARQRPCPVPLALPAVSPKGCDTASGSQRDAHHQKQAGAGPATVQPLPSSAMVKLNIGCFTTQFPDWRNSDILDLRDWARERGFPFSQWSIEDKIPYDDGVVDLIFCMHCLEHVNYEAGARFLKECHRVLKPGGVVRLLVPDARALCQAYLDGTIGKFDEFLAPEMRNAPATAKLWEPMCANHQALYDEPTLTGALKAAGFATVARAEFGKSRSPVMQAETKDLYPGLSLIVEAVR